MGTYVLTNFNQFCPTLGFFCQLLCALFWNSSHLGYATRAMFSINKILDERTKNGQNCLKLKSIKVHYALSLGWIESDMGVSIPIQTI